MFSKVSKLGLVLCAIALVFSSCTPEAVNPTDQSGVQGRRALPGSNDNFTSPNSSQHVALLPLCGDMDSTNLVTVGGVSTVNYCGFTPCTGTMPEWGEASFMYGEDINGNPGMELNLNLAQGWMVRQGWIKLGTAADFNLQNGIPQIDSTYEEKIVLPANTAHWQFPMGQNLPQDFYVCAKLDLGKMDFFLGMDSMSFTSVWMYNGDWSGSNPSPSAFLWPYTATPCSNSATIEQVH